MTSRISRVARVFGLAVTVAALGGAACQKGGGTFTPVGDDAGPGGGGVDFSKIGTACTYDPATEADPTNTCPVGLACLIVTRNGEINSGLALDFWEDQTTIYRPDGKDEGYCTLFGTLGS